MKDIRAEHVTIVYEDPQARRELVAVADLTLHVAAGEFFVLLGPSGCGKTTFLNAIAGLVPLRQGSLKVGGKPVTGPGPDRVMVFQEYALFPWRTVWGNIQFALEVSKRRWPNPEARIRRVVRLVGLEGFEHSYPHQLSGGMRQRVGLARALVVEPDVLLMDEPFGALDAMTREVMQQELLRVFRASRPTVVFVTHSIDEAIVLGDRIAVMTARPGRIKAVLPVPLPPERWHPDVRGSPEYAELRRTIWELLQEEVGRLLRQREEPARAP